MREPGVAEGKLSIDPTNMTNEKMQGTEVQQHLEKHKFAQLLHFFLATAIWNTEGKDYADE